MHISKLLPTLDNAGRRLVLAEIVGEPVSVKLARRRHKMLMKTRISTSVSAQSTVDDKNSALFVNKAITEVTNPTALPVKIESKHKIKLDTKVISETTIEASTQFELKDKTETMTVKKAQTALELNSISAQSSNTQPSSSLPLTEEIKAEDSTLDLPIEELGKEEE